MSSINKYSQILTGRKPKPMSDSDRDPRPDLREDHILWASVLITAQKLDVKFLAERTFTTKPDQSSQPPTDLPCGGSIFGLLHGLRCGGAKLEKLENGNLKLDYEPLLGTNGGAWDKDVLLKDWLMPFRQEMSTVFKRAAA